MFKMKSLARHIRSQLLVSAAIMPLCGLAHAQQDTAANENDSAVSQQETKNAAETEDQAAKTEAEESLEVIEVTGIANSLKEAAFLKRNANQILDAISSEDIGQLPDDNIAEALQRVTGVQIGRDENGDGSGIQVRGLTQNRIEINGVAMASDGEDGSNSFDAIDSALFSAIEVIKSPTADMAEGALGATVRLKMKGPLKHKKSFLKLDARGTKDEIPDEGGHKFVLSGAHKLDLGRFGELGGSLIATNSEDTRETHKFDSNWSPLSINQIDGSQSLAGLAVFAPKDMFTSISRVQEDRDSATAALQWANTDRTFDVTLSVTHSSQTKESLGNSLVFRGGGFDLLERNQALSPMVDELVVLGPFTRDALSAGQDPGGQELVAQVDKEIIDGEEVEVVNYVPADSLERYIVTQATLNPTNLTTRQEMDARQETKEQTTYILEGNWEMSDTLLMNFQVSRSEANTYEERYQLRYLPERSGSDDSGEAFEVVLSDNYINYNYGIGADIPTYGLYTLSDSGDQIISNALLEESLYNLDSLRVQANDRDNLNESAKIDFTWLVDRGIFTNAKFGAYYENVQNRRMRREPELGTLQFENHSIFSEEWLDYDQDYNTSRIENPNPNSSNGGGQEPSFDWVRSTMGYLYGDDTVNAFNSLISTTEDIFPNGGSDAAGVPTWLAFDGSFNDMTNMFNLWFPGREGDCTRGQIGSDACSVPFVDPDLPEGFEFVGESTTYEKASTISMPGIAFTTPDRGTAGGNSRDIYSAYVMTDFELDVYKFLVTGNVGVRYSRTERTVKGSNVTTFVNSTGSAFNDFDGVRIREVDFLSVDVDYSDFLPSMNLNVQLQENMYLRMAASKTMSRPNIGDMNPSTDFNDNLANVRLGNPYLLPEYANNYDLSWEWYVSDTNVFSAALFRKEFSDFLVDNFTTGISDTDRNGNGKLDDLITFKQKINGGDGDVNGVEVSALHTMDYLPGFLSGFGVQANYTFTDSSQESGLNELDNSNLPAPLLSENTINLVLFYDKYGFNFRAAYNYRDEYYVGQSAAGPDYNLYQEVFNPVTDQVEYVNKAILLPVWSDEFATLDLSASYTYKNAKIFFQVRNALSEISRKYVGDKEKTKYLTREYTDTGAFYTAGISYTF